jgi:hypothetical protein
MEQINPKDLEAYLKHRQAEEANRAISQTDGITIYQAEPDVPGVYVDSYQKATDAYNQGLLQEQTANAYQTMNALSTRPLPYATGLDQFPSAMAGNPNVTIVEPSRQTVDNKGNVVIY